MSRQPAHVGQRGLTRSADYIRRFLEGKPPAKEAEAAWQRLVEVYRATKNIIGGCGAFLRAAEITEPPLHQISAMANWLNSDREIIDQMDIAERSALFKPMARLMEMHLPTASATELSRLAWLYLHAGDTRRSLEVAELGLKRDPENAHCQRLVENLTS